MNNQMGNNQIVTIRLHLIRHGETVANTQSIVVGQSDSDLTNTGIEQTRALSHDPRVCCTCNSFWRIYSSDLKRTQHTAAILLRLEGVVQKDSKGRDDEGFGAEDISPIRTEFSEPLEGVGVRLDRRLREIAKGARQGFPKTFTMDEAINERKRLDIAEINPLLESDDDAWIRMKSWMDELIIDRVRERVRGCCEDKGESNFAAEVTMKPRCCASSQQYNVLAVGHSAVFRTFLTRLLGAERLRNHPNSIYDEGDERIVIPNTSLTIIDVHVSVSKEFLATLEMAEHFGLLKSSMPIDDFKLSTEWESLSQEINTSFDIVVLTSTDHCVNIGSKS